MAKIYLQEKLTGHQGQVLTFNTNNEPVLNTITPKNDRKINIKTQDTGVTIDVSDSSSHIFIPAWSGIYNCSVNVPNDGTYTVRAVKGTNAKNETIKVIGNGNYYVEFESFTSPILNDNSWDLIKSAAQQNTGSTYWSVGDCKQVTLNGNAGAHSFSNVAVNVFIIDFNHNGLVEGFGISFQFGKKLATDTSDICFCDSSYGTTAAATNKFCINTSNTNIGGWRDSSMRKNIIGTSLTSTNTFISCLPSDLKSALKLVNKYTNVSTNTTASFELVSDYVFLLSGSEYTGVGNTLNGNESQYNIIYSYYSNHTVAKYDINAATFTSNVVHWTRTRRANSTGYFIAMVVNNTQASTSTRYSYGIAPAFVVG